MEELAWLKSALLAVYPLFIVDYQEFGIWPYVGGIRRARVRDIEELEDNRSMSVGVDLHKSTFNAAVVDGETSWGLSGPRTRRAREVLRIASSWIHCNHGELVPLVLGLPSA
ncbi:MAG: hypothetical protein ACP5G6_08725, partial [Conexivisphaera sp.]